MEERKPYITAVKPNDKDIKAILEKIRQKYGCGKSCKTCHCLVCYKDTLFIIKEWEKIRSEK